MQLNNDFKIKMFKSNALQHKYVKGDYINFNSKDIDNTNGKVYCSSDGLIHVIYDGLIEITVQLWINANNNCRPWIALLNHDTGKVLNEVIDDNSSGYLSATLPSILIKNTGHTTYTVSIIGADSDINLGAGSGFNTSYVQVKLYP